MDNIYLELLIFEKGKVWPIPKGMVNFLTVSKESEIEDWFQDKITEKIDFKTHRLYVIYIDPVEKNKMEVDKLFKTIEEVTGITREQIKGKRGKDNIAFARQLFHTFYIEQELGTLEQAGEKTSNDHSTVIHSIKTVNIAKEQKGWRSQWYKEIKEIIYPTPAPRLTKPS